MTDQPEPLDLRSPDIAEDKRQELLRLFPEVRTEGGQLDFERLKLALGEAVDVGKVKMIYIDPPYNTGNDFIYPDNYTESLQTYLAYTGQVDAEGRKFGTNSDTDGRFHSKWLNMMYPRLYLARNLLRQDGAICVSVDDNEIRNARSLLNEIFGEENFVASIIWQKVYSPRMDDAGISVEHDYILIYGASSDFVPNRMPFKQNERQFTGVDEQTGKTYRPRSLRKEGKNSRRSDRPNLFYALAAPNGSKVYPMRSDGTEGCWRMGVAKYERLMAQGMIEWLETPSGWQPYVKQFYDPNSTRPYMTIWPHSEVGHTHGAVDEVKRLMGNAIFNNPKPVELIARLTRIASSIDNLDDDLEVEIILDFFAGSGTTAHAVLDQNRQDGSNRNFILVQLPEPTGRTDYPTIADITKERVRRVIKNMRDEDAGKLDLDGANKQDRGFRVFKLAESNFKPWNADVPHDAQALAQQLELHIDHIRDGRTADDLLYEILLKSGFPLTTPVDMLTLTGKTVYGVAHGALFICLESDLTLELIRAMADLKPERVVCLDEGFAGNDQLKANAVQIFKNKGVTSFKTV